MDDVLKVALQRMPKPIAIEDMPPPTPGVPPTPGTEAERVTH
jgi:hypothetical protein